MVTKKDLIIVISCVFCLASALFMMMPTRSSSSNGVYDPWMDLNDDGVIDSTDLGMLGAAFGTAGDTTKNVNVTNWPTQQKTFPENLLLRGTKYSNEEYPYDHRSLVDNTTPYPNQNLEWAPSRDDYDYSFATLTTTTSYAYNQTFVYDKIPLRSYKILGRPAVSLLFNVTNSPAASFSISLYAELGVVSTTNDWTTIAVLSGRSQGFNGAAMKEQMSAYLTAHIVSPGFTVNPNGRIAVRVIFYGYTDSGTTNLTLEVCFAMNSDEFLVDIPIVESP